MSQKYKGLWEYYEELYANKLDNLEILDKFLVTYYLLSPNHGEIENQNRPITNKVIDLKK